MTNLRGLNPGTGSGKLHGLDHLRALAIIAVFLFHYQLFEHPEWIETLGSFGWTGVDLFFVLSGYLIAGQLFKNNLQGKPFPVFSFYVKRFLRIIPAFLVVLCLYFMVPAFREKESLPPLWKFLTFTQNLGLDPQHQGTFSHAWSLCIEEQFYFLLPLILVTLAFFKWFRRSGSLLLLLFLVGFVFRYYSYITYVAPYAAQDMFWINWSRYIYYPTPTRLDGLLIGVSIAAMQWYKPAWKQWFDKHLIISVILFVSFLSLAFLLNGDRSSLQASLFAFPLVALVYGCLLLISINPASVLYKKGSWISEIIARLSYSLYLSHKGIIHLTQGLLSKWGIAADGAVMFCCCIVTCFLAAWLLNVLVEKPFMRLRDRLLQKKVLTKAIA